jgi:hypothetical protein
MSLIHYDRIFLVPPPRRPQEHGIGRSPRFAPGWWLAGTAIVYAAVALICFLVL